MNSYIIKMELRRILTRIYSKKPIQRKVIFNSFGGKQYSADPRAISEKLHELYPEYEIVWVIWPRYRDNNLIPKYVRIIDGRWEFVKELPTAIAYITTNPLERDIVKKEGQFFVQTWHGDRGFKRCLYEAWGYREGVKVDIYDNVLTDLCIAASDYGEDVYHKAFKYNGKILKIGMPRNDRLLNCSKKEINEIKNKIGISPQKKILTYAPTFSDTKNGIQQVTINIQQTLEILNRDKEEWICILRSHSASMGIEVYNTNNILNLSNYPDMTDILLISDMLITDFSSCAGDFILRKKPVILALFDEFGYKEIQKSFRIDIEETGFFIARNQKELNNIISNNTEEEFALNCENILKYYKTIETGNSAKVICDEINKAYNKLKNNN